MFRRRHRHETTESDDRCQLGSSRLRCSAVFLQRFEGTTLGHPGSVARTFRAADERVSANGMGLHSTEVAYLLLTQQPRVLFSVFPRIFLLMLLRFIDSTA